MKMIKPSVRLVDALEDLFTEHTIEKAARTCYKSGVSTDPMERREFLKKLAERNHLSPFEFSFVMFEITCSRSCSHQLVRHRHFSFCQESQRYVEIDEPVCIKPEGFDDWDEGTGTLWGISVNGSFAAYDRFVNENGIAPQAARSVLPNCIATKLVMTGNLRSWFEFLEKRLFTPGADCEMIEIANQILTELKREYPDIMEAWL